MKNNKYYVSCYGGVWALSETKYKKMLSALKKKEQIDLDILGKQVAWNVLNVTDGMDKEEIKWELQRIKERKILYTKNFMKNN
jgi:hypothetical protein